MQNSFHKKFQLNNNSFTTVDELLKYAKGFSDEVYHFLESWFSEIDVIFVKTSGSTGTPKSISLKKEFVINSAKATGNFFDLQENTSALLCLPMQYIAGKLMLIRAITLGWKIDIVDANSNPLKDIKKEYDFSAMVSLQLENSLTKIHFIKKIIVGGGAVSKSLQEKLQDISTQVFATYGMTETITHIAVKELNKQFTNNNINSFIKVQLEPFYKVLPGVIIYKDIRNCLVISAPKVSDEIIFTNDVINLISDTQFEWLGRFDNIINSGGIKLNPERIEEKLSKIIINRFFVAGIYDEKLGEKLILIIENVVSSSVEKTLMNTIKNLKIVSRFEYPKEIYFVDKFVDTNTGKIQRKKTIAKIFTK